VKDISEEQRKTWSKLKPALQRAGKIAPDPGPSAVETAAIVGAQEPTVTSCCEHAFDKGHAAGGAQAKAEERARLIDVLEDHASALYRDGFQGLARGYRTAAQTLREADRIAGEDGDGA
jgi:hypothetical protein